MDAPPSPVELQLRRYFERVFTHAQYSESETCFARELANFRERYDAMPDESLESAMAGRCQAPGDGFWRSSDIYSDDGTALDSPLTSELLEVIAENLKSDLGQFSVFGITARPVGANALVLLEGADPDASIQVGVADDEGRVRVEGQTFHDVVATSALINQGDFGTQYCEPDQRVSEPKYAFTCQLAVGDDEAWVSVVGYYGSENMVGSTGEVLARRAGVPPASEYHRRTISLPPGDTANAILSYVNDARGKLGRRPLVLAPTQSHASQKVYEEIFELKAHGARKSATPLRNELLAGNAIGAPIWSSRIMEGVACDGDASDWLAYHLQVPVYREVLMSSAADLISIATHGKPSMGFGVAAVTYLLLSPERELMLEELMAKRIAELRGKRKTHRLPVLPELREMAARAASGQSDPDPPFRAALRRFNALSGRVSYWGALLTEVPWDVREFELPAELAGEELSFMISVTHHKDEGQLLSRPLAFIWFPSSRPDGVVAHRQVTATTL